MRPELLMVDGCTRSGLSSVAETAGRPFTGPSPPHYFASRVGRRLPGRVAISSLVSPELRTIDQLSPSARPARKLKSASRNSWPGWEAGRPLRSADRRTDFTPDAVGRANSWGSPSGSPSWATKTCLPGVVSQRWCTRRTGLEQAGWRVSVIDFS